MFTQADLSPSDLFLPTSVPFKALQPPSPPFINLVLQRRPQTGQQHTASQVGHERFWGRGKGWSILGPRNLSMVLFWVSTFSGLQHLSTLKEFKPVLPRENQSNRTSFSQLLFKTMVHEFHVSQELTPITAQHFVLGQEREGDDCHYARI